MTALPIVTGKDTPVLRAKAKPVAKVTKQVKKLIKNMRDTLASDEVNGVGIAAAQIGESVQVFLATIGGQDTGKLTVFINPKILYKSKETAIDEEGCLSLPNQFAKIARPISIVIEYTDESGKTSQRELHEFDARVVQHEYDHLQGVLFIDYL